MIAIAEYDQKEDDLSAVTKDIKTITDLFRDHLGYHVDSGGDPLKLRWTKDEIITLLKERARFLLKNLDVYDGLVVILSGHGLNGSIVCSDHEQIPKLFIHRLFSMDFNVTGLRDIPRLFVFDCCDGHFDWNRCEEEMEDGDDNNGNG